MLLQIQPEQVVEFKELLREGLKKVSPSADFNVVLESLLLGAMTLWISYKVRDGRKKSSCFLLTEILKNDLEVSKELNIYCLYSFDRISLSEWYEGAEALKKYAKSVGCSKVVGLVENELLLRMYERLGAKKKYFVELEVL